MSVLGEDIGGAENQSSVMDKASICSRIAVPGPQISNKEKKCVVD
jgi:hypothetical protein